MKFALAKVVEVEPLSGFKLRLKFGDGAEGVFNCKPILWGEVFEPLKDRAYFAKVFLDYGAPSWPNGADLDPGVLRNEIEKAARKSRPRKRSVMLVNEKPGRYGE